MELTRYAAENALKHSSFVRNSHLALLLSGTHHAKLAQLYHNGVYPELFPVRLHRVLSDPNAPIASWEGIDWDTTGRHLVIHHPDILVDVVLPQYFAGIRYTSFVKKLYRWGFKRIGKGPDRFQHELFRRDEAELCRGMVLRKSGTSKGPQELRGASPNSGTVASPDSVDTHGRDEMELYSLNGDMNVKGWKCDRCSTMISDAKARCSRCKAWRGGKREGITGKARKAKWKCHNCEVENLAVKKRCMNCQCWPGGIRDNIRVRNPKQKRRKARQVVQRI